MARYHMTIQQIADRLGITKAEVRAALRSGLLKMRRMLEAERSRERQ